MSTDYHNAHLKLFLSKIEKAKQASYRLKRKVLTMRYVRKVHREISIK